MVLNNPHILSFNEIKEAAERIEGGIIHTPLCVCIIVLKITLQSVCWVVGHGLTNGDKPVTGTFLRSACGILIGKVAKTLVG